MRVPGWEESYRHFTVLIDRQRRKTPRATRPGETMGVQSTSNSFLETFYFFSFPRLAGRGLLGHGQILLAKMLLRSLKYLSGLWVKAKQSFEKCARVEFHRATWTAGEGPGYHCWCTEASLSRILSYTSFSPLDKGPGILPLHESDGGQQRCQCRICNRNAHLTTWGQSWPGMSLYAARSGPGTTQSKTTQSKSGLCCPTHRGRRGRPRDTDLLLSTKISSQCRSKLAGPLVLLESTHYLGTYGKAYVGPSKEPRNHWLIIVPHPQFPRAMFSYVLPLVAATRTPFKSELQMRRLHIIPGASIARSRGRSSPMKYQLFAV
jgi:hypothetical protein